MLRWLFKTRRTLARENQELRNDLQRLIKDLKEERAYIQNLTFDLSYQKQIVNTLLQKIKKAEARRVLHIFHHKGGKAIDKY